MKVLVIGGGGREHALAWCLDKSPSVSELHAAPGNPGIESVGILHSAADYVELAERLHIDLTVVGPEAPLVAGLVDEFRARKLNIAGPTAQNAALEGSKIHSKRLMSRLGVPTARFATANSKAAAREELAHFSYPVVLKTDGLAAGKGVIIAANRIEAEQAVETLACPLVIEEFLEGEELSFIVVCDGKRGVPLEPSQDHKRIFDNDQGPNTGGMGAYSDSLLLSSAERGRIMETVVNPVIRATQFTGFLYAGLMMSAEGPKVLEFNVRMGDPETQPLMMRFTGDLAEALLSAARGEIQEDQFRWSPEPATCVVLASRGYPATSEGGVPIEGLDRISGAVAFHAGTRREGDRIVTAGGRVLGVTASGPTLRRSIDSTYAAVSQIHFDGMQFRRDIGARGLRRYTVG